MDSHSTDVLVIGGGPAGYVAGIRLGQLGTKAILVERENMGGTCLNWGCIPSKVLIAAGRKLEDARSGTFCGITGGDALAMDLPKLMEYKQSVVAKLTGGVRQLVKAQGTTIIEGTARFSSPNEVVVTQKEGECTVSFKKVIVCSGSEPVALPFLPVDNETVIDSKKALDLTAIPESLMVIGGGVIGLELGQFYALLGTQVTVVEAMEQILPGIDNDCVKVLARSLKKMGITLHTSTKILSAEKTPTGMLAKLEGKKGIMEVEAQKILVTVGRRPLFKHLNLHEAGLEIATPYVPVNERMETAIPHIYAAGDITGNPLLAHRASAQAEVAAENASGHAAVYRPLAVPAVCYTTPEIATVGLTPAEAAAREIPVKTGKMMFGAVGRALAGGHDQGFVQYVAHADTDEILGAQIVGNEASELISEALLAVEQRITARALGKAIHAHPTLGEAAMEAARAIHDEAIHIAPPRKR
ncbi:dihydrolipoyl dehydrogenase [Myxococcota bacterium]|nr:dihydrolipoyl dehydrogenase [Myxococcota bacterium]